MSDITIAFINGHPPLHCDDAVDWSWDGSWFWFTSGGRKFLYSAFNIQEIEIG